MATTTTNITDPNVAAGGSSTVGGNSANNESITATGANDTLLGGSGSDTLIGTGANETFDTSTSGAIYGGQGSFSGGNDYLSASGGLGNGDDFILGGGTAAVAGGAAATYIFSQVVGSNGNDIIDLTRGRMDSTTSHDSYAVSAGAGNDTILGGAASETIYAGAGNDSISGETGYKNYISGDAGNDYINVGAGASGTLLGGDGDDTLIATGANDMLYGNTGNDTLTLSGAGATAFGGAGNDLLTAGGNAAAGPIAAVTITGNNNQFYSGDLGNDTVTLQFSTGLNDTVYGGNGDDTIFGSQGAGNQLYGNQGNDTIYLGGGTANVMGAALTAGTIFGGQGNDLLYDNGFIGFISGDAGLDSIFASSAQTTVYGGDGNDSILATGSAVGDQLYGNAGNDIITITSATSVATVFGGAGNDLITVTYTTNTTTSMPTTAATTANGQTFAVGSTTPQTAVVAGGGAHYLSGDLGTDTISGGAGNDTFAGGQGADILISHRMAANSTNAGAPSYQAAGGADTFLFHNGDSTAAAPGNGGTGSDAASGGEINLDHITGFLLSVTGQAFNAGTATGATSETYINGQAGDNLYFGAANSGAALTATLDTNVFYGTATLPAGAMSEASHYAAAYAYAFGTGGTNTAPTADAHFANAVDYIVVLAGADIFVFDHSGNGVALDGTGTNNGATTGTTGVFQNSQTPGSQMTVNGTQNGAPTSVTTVNIYH